METTVGLDFLWNEGKEKELETTVGLRLGFGWKFPKTTKSLYLP